MGRLVSALESSDKRPAFRVAGYGNIAPATNSGRVFCIFFALIGIPFTLTVIADLGVLMASAVAVLYRRLRQRCAWTRSEAAQRFGKRYGKTLTVVLVLFLLIVYIGIGGGIFMIWEEWTFLESFYFCFITMTTIGFGDLVPGTSSLYSLSLSLFLSPSLSLSLCLSLFLSRPSPFLYRVVCGR